MIHTLSHGGRASPSKARTDFTEATRGRRSCLWCRQRSRLSIPAAYHAAQRERDLCRSSAARVEGVDGGCSRLAGHACGENSRLGEHDVPEADKPLGVLSETREGIRSSECAGCLPADRNYTEAPDLHCWTRPCGLATQSAGERWEKMAVRRPVCCGGALEELDCTRDRSDSDRHEQTRSTGSALRPISRTLRHAPCGDWLGNGGGERPSIAAASRAIHEQRYPMLPLFITLRRNDASSDGRLTRRERFGSGHQKTRSNLASARLRACHMAAGAS